METLLTLTAYFRSKPECFTYSYGNNIVWLALPWVYSCFGVTSFTSPPSLSNEHVHFYS